MKNSMNLWLWWALYCSWKLRKGWKFAKEYVGSLNCHMIIKPYREYFMVAWKNFFVVVFYYVVQYCVFFNFVSFVQGHYWDNCIKISVLPMPENINKTCFTQQIVGTREKKYTHKLPFFIFPSICVSVCPSVCLSIFLSVCLSVPSHSSATV